MAISKSCGAAFGLCVFLAATCWGSIVQTQDFDLTSSGLGDGSFTVANGFTMNNVMPFDTSTGILTGFSVDWTITFYVSGIAATEGAVITETPGGTYYLGGIAYWGYGDVAQGLSNTPGASFSAPPLTEALSYSFAAPDTSLYNPALLAVVVGPWLFSVEWDAPFNIAVYNTTSWTTEAKGSVTVTYNEVPEPSGLVLALGGWAGVAMAGRRLCGRR